MMGIWSTSIQRSVGVAHSTYSTGNLAGTTGVIGALIILCAASIASATPVDSDYFYASTVSEQEDELQLHALLLNVDANHTDKAVIFIAQGNFNNAIAELDYTLVRFPNNPRALTLLGAVAKLTHRSTLPIAYYERALSLYPQYALTHAQYGEYLSQIGRVDEAIAQLKTAIEMDRALVVAYVWLSEAYSKTGRRELAQQAAEQARQLGYQPRGKVTSP